MNIRHPLTFLLLFCILDGWCSASQPDISYGLTFRAHTYEKEARTSLHLTPGGPLRVKGEFTLEFDVRLRRERECFGSIFQIVHGKGAHSIDLIGDILSERAFALVADGKTLLRMNIDDLPGFEEDRWLHIRLDIDDVRNRLRLQIGDNRQETPYEQDTGNKYDLYFGGTPYATYFTSEVPPMTVRDIRLRDGGKLLRFWPLDRHREGISPDQVEGAPAVALNPVWEIDRHVFWRRTASFTVSGRYPQTAYDPVEGRIFIARDTLLCIYHTAEDSLVRVQTGNSRPFNNMANCMAYQPDKDRLVSYCLETGSAAFYDCAAERWSNTDGTRTPLPRFWHHNRCVLPRGELVTFGGYGFHHYQSLLNVLPADSAGWRAPVDLSAGISPRYLSAMTAADEGKLLVFGGYGSLSGSQQEAPANRYGLYRIDPHTEYCEKLRQVEQPDACYTCSNAMVYDSLKRVCYALTYDNRRSSTWLRLREVPLDPAAPVRVLGDSIPYFFSDVESYCDLYLDRANARLIALTSHLDRNGDSEIGLYALAFPPMSAAEVTVPEKQGQGWLALLAWGLIAASAADVLFLRSKRHTPEKPEPDAQSAQKREALPRETYNIEKRPRSIRLMGGFQAIDAEGNDITGNFTQTIKYIFLLILLETYKSGRGISSQKLNELLWYDKDEESARNNRNVNIRKMRVLLDRIGGIKVSNDNSYWHVEIADGEVFCDYISILALIRDVRESGDRDKLERLLLLLSGGALLVNTQTEWVDGYKSEFSSLIIETMVEICRRERIRDDLKLTLKIAEVIMIHDSIDEDAIRLKCYALFHMGKKGLAKQAFDSFRAEYERLLGTPSSLSLTDLTGQ